MRIGIERFQSTNIPLLPTLQIEKDFQKLAQFIRDAIIGNKVVKEEIKSFRENFRKMQFCFSGNEFDELMQKVDEDELDLTKLENHVREEFDEIGGDVEKISKEVDEVVEEKSAMAVK